MKKSKTIRKNRGQGKRRAITTRERDLQYVYTLDRDFPAEFKAISQLQPLKQWIDEHGLDEFRIRLGETVIVYRSRYHDEAYNRRVTLNLDVPPMVAAQYSKEKALSSELPYYRRISELVHALKMATTALQSAADRFQFVDITHIMQILAAANSIPTNAFKSGHPLRQLYKTIHYIEALMVAIQLGTGVLTAPRRRGKPSSRYVWPAIELVELWEEMSGSPFTTPRQPTSGKNSEKEFPQHSTQFVYLGLKIIDPNVETANVVTAVRNALALQKKLRETPIKSDIAKLFSFD